MLQLIRHITSDPNDHTELSLIFANQTEKDILVQKELEECASKHPKQFKLWYTLDTPPESEFYYVTINFLCNFCNDFSDWKFSTGFINADMIKERLFAPASDTLIVMCGPPPMVNFACIPALDKLGYDKDLCFAY